MAHAFDNILSDILTLKKAAFIPAGDPAAQQGGAPMPPPPPGAPAGGPPPGPGGMPVDPATGLPIDPATGMPIDPNTGQPIDPAMLQQMAGGAPMPPPPPGAPAGGPPPPPQGGDPIQEIMGVIEQLGMALEQAQQKLTAIENQNTDLVKKYSEMSGKLEVLTKILDSAPQL